MYAPRSDWRFRDRELGPIGEGVWETCYEWDVPGNNRLRLPSDNRHGGSDDNPDLSPAPSDHSDSDSQGDEEGVHWEWMPPNPFMGGRRFKIRLSQRERRKRRRAARNS